MDNKTLKRLPGLLDEVIELGKTFDIFPQGDQIVLCDKKTKNLAFSKLRGEPMSIDLWYGLKNGLISVIHG